MAAYSCHFNVVVARTAAILLCCWLTDSVCFLQAQEPVVQRIESSGLQPGQKATLTVVGTALKSPVRLWTPFAEFQLKAGHDPKVETAAVFEGEVPGTVRPGLYPARLVAAGGCSEAAFVVVDDLVSITLTAESEVPATAQVLPSACCLTGFMNPVKPRYFRIPAKAGRAVSVQLMARQLNSEMDPVLQVTDPAGREVAFCDDVPGFEGDASLQFVPAADGDYLLQVRDVKYAGGPRHFFYLRVGPFPIATVSRPRVATAGQQIELLNAKGESVAPVQLAADGFVTATSVNAPAVVADAGGSVLLSVMTVSGTAVSEVEPNDTKETATAVTGGPTVLSGSLQQPGDVDWFRISADAASPLCITAHTRDVRSPADVVLQLWSPDGKKLAEADDTAPQDAQLVTSLPAAGEYFLRVAELASQGGVEWTYDLEINRGEGRLEVTLSADRLQVPRGGNASLTATVKRIHYDGPVVLEAQGLPGSLSMVPVWLSAKQTTVPITLTAAEAANADVRAESGLLTLMAAVPDRNPGIAAVVRVAAPAPRKKDADPFRSRRVREDVFTAVAPAAQYVFRTEPAGLTVKRGTSGTVKVLVTRHADWPMPIDMALAVPADQLPPGVTVPNFKLENNEGVLTITAAADAAIGKFTVFAQGTAKKDKVTATHPVPPVSVEITE